MLVNLFNYSIVCFISSTDAYGSGARQAFTESARGAGITIAAAPTFSRDSVDFSSQYDEVQRSEVRILVIVCPTQDVSRFIRGAFEYGIGGDGFLWLGALTDSSLWASDAQLSSDLELRERVLRGYFGVSPCGGQGTAAYNAFIARRRRMPRTTDSSGRCNLQTDDDGTMIWAQDHDGNSSSPIA